MVATHHSRERIKERLGLSKRLADKLATQAYERGHRRTEYSGSIRRYLDKEYEYKGGAHLDIRVYNQHVFIFDGTILVTCWRLPNKYQSAKPQTAQAASTSPASIPSDAGRP